LKKEKEAQKFTKSKIVANQVEYNLMVRNQGKFMKNMESEILPYCQENNIMFIAWRPLMKGHLTKPGFKILDELSEKYEKTRSQIALNWLISKKGLVTISKTSNIEHLKENLGAIGWKLEKKDVEKLDKDFETVRTRKEYEKWM